MSPPPQDEDVDFVPTLGQLMAAREAMESTPDQDMERSDSAPVAAEPESVDSEGWTDLVVEAGSIDAMLKELGKEDTLADVSRRKGMYMNY